MKAERMKLRPCVLQFARQMEAALRRNDHKDGWDGCEPGVLLSRLREEATELRRVLHGCPSRVRSEAADVANFAMMIADNAEHDAIAEECAALRRAARKGA